MKVVLIDQVHGSFKDTFINWGWEVIEADQWTANDLLDKIHEFEGIIIRSRIKLDKEFLSKAINLKFIGRPGSGLENIDVDYCKLNNIEVFRSPEGNRDALGEHIIGMLLMLFNNLKRADLQVRKGIWHRESNRSIELKGKTVGIIGYGFMGSAFAEKLDGFGVNVIAHDKYKTNFSSPIVEEVSLQELQKRADIVSLHTPLTQETVGMVDATFIEKFSKPIVLINSARGKSVILKDLLIALNKGDVSGACLDVLELETDSFEKIEVKDQMVINDLLKKEEVIFSPHIAGWSFEAKERMAVVIIDKIQKFFLSNK